MIFCWIQVASMGIRYLLVSILDLIQQVVPRTQPNWFITPLARIYSRDMICICMNTYIYIYTHKDISNQSMEVTYVKKYQWAPSQTSPGRFFALFRSARWGTDMHGAKSSRGNEGEKSKGTDHHQAVRISGYGSIPIDTFLVV